MSGNAPRMTEIQHWVVACVALVASFSVSAQSLVADRPDSSAVELLMFDSKGCVFCARWLDEVGGVYARTTEGRAAPLRRLDLGEVDRSGVHLAKPVRYTPTFVLVMTGPGIPREVGRITGYPGEAHFWGLLGELLRNLPES